MRHPLPICGAAHPKLAAGNVCTEPEGHAGGHVATDECGRPEYYWTPIVGETSEESETTALDVVYHWLGGDKAARQYLLEARYQSLVTRIAVALDEQRQLLAR